MDLLSWLLGRGGESGLRERIKALEEAVDHHKREVKSLRLEWEDVYDKVNRVMGRLNARIRKAGATSGPESDDQGAPHTPASPTGTHGLLSEMRAKHGVLPR